MHILEPSPISYRDYSISGSIKKHSLLQLKDQFMTGKIEKSRWGTKYVLQGTHFSGVRKGKMGYCTPKWGTYGSPAARSKLVVVVLYLLVSPSRFHWKKWKGNHFDAWGAEISIMSSFPWKFSIIVRNRLSLIFGKFGAWQLIKRRIWIKFTVSKCACDCSSGRKSDNHVLRQFTTVLCDLLLNTAV